MRILYLTLFLAGLAFSQEATAFIKYFRSDRDFVADNPLLATERNGMEHIVVAYNEKKQPILKIWVTATGDTVRKEMLSYDPAGKLAGRYLLNKDGEFVKIVKYGQSEPWSKEYRAYAYAKNENLSFEGQQSIFTLAPGGEVRTIEFRTVDQTPYGQITLAYDYLGYPKEEIWRSLPGGKIIRRFVYDFDIMTQVKQIWEFGRNNELVSHVALEMAPEDELYKEPPPRTGNILDEVDIILEEIRARRVVAPIPAVIPKMEWDRLVLKNGEEYQIQFIAIDEQGVRFQMSNSDEILTIPLARVRTVTNKWGERVYPQ
ncbi:MAG: hypothetical protein GXO92_04630 [FCB group bacterium]|nr:hypothetical protein [FCB group bacterium]